MNSQQAKASLQQTEWEDGKIFPVVEGPYRYRVVVHCSFSGRQKALFANGEHAYFCYTELCSGDGSWIRQGNGIVPVLPDSRLIMVVEQRPAQGRHGSRPVVAKISGKDTDLSRFGPFSSLEFPGGAVDPNEGLKMGALRELIQETGIAEQEAELWRCLRPVHLFGSDIAIQHFSNVVFLPKSEHKAHVEDDGGLHVLALTYSDVLTNIRTGVICSGQAALTSWNFYLEVCEMRMNKAMLEDCRAMGYFDIEKVKIAQPK